MSDPGTKGYTPAQGEWARRDPAEVGMRPGAVSEAIAFAQAHEFPWPRDLSRVIGRNDPPPYNEALGPVKERGGPSGLVVRRGYIAAEWGDPERVDLTFSATKSYLSVVAGLAYDRGLIRDPEDLVRDSVGDGGFDSDHNAQIRWRHLLQQTSEWSGECFGIPDTVDHNRSLVDPDAPKGQPRELHEPGTYWEYNDVRVNRLALALLRVWGEPLPDVLRREVMEPIGATDTWEWHGYRNSWVEVNGRRIQSVSGGAHWGGGLFINSYDHARLGLLMLRRGCWGERRLVSEEWLRRSLEPCDIRPGYGYLWWLNTGRAAYPAGSEQAFAARGAGGNVVYIDPVHDLVVVTRWTADTPEVVGRFVQAIGE